MRPVHIIPGIFTILMIAFVLLAGCTFFQGQNPVQPSTPGVTAATTPEPATTPIPEVPQTCPEIGGTVCPAGETCSGSLSKTTDGQVCCSGTCVAPGSATPVQTNAGAITTITGKTTPSNPVATATAIPVTLPQNVPSLGVTVVATVAVPVQTYEIVREETCAVVGGNICLTDETCSGSLIKTSDSERCCAGTCILPSYTVTLTPEPTVIPVVAKTCEEIGGNICPSGQSCTGGLVKTTDSSACCAGTCA